MHPENDNTQPTEKPKKKESFLARMRRQGRLVIGPPQPGELNVLAKLREMREYVPPESKTKGETEP